MLYFVDFLIAHTGVFILFLVLALSGVALIWAGITHFRYVKYAQEGRIDIGGQVLKAILKAALLALLASLALVRLLLGDYRSATLDQPRSEATQGFRNGRARPGEEDEEREYKAETAVYIGSLRIIGGIALFIFGILLVFCFIIFDEVS